MMDGLARYTATGWKIRRWRATVLDRALVPFLCGIQMTFALCNLLHAEAINVGGRTGQAELGSVHQVRDLRAVAARQLLLLLLDSGGVRLCPPALVKGRPILQAERRVLSWKALTWRAVAVLHRKDFPLPHRVDVRWLAALMLACAGVDQERGNPARAATDTLRIVGGPREHQGGLVTAVPSAHHFSSAGLEQDP